MENIILGYKGENRRQCTLENCAPVASLSAKLKIVIIALTLVVGSNATAIGIAYTALEKSNRNEKVIDSVWKKIENLGNKIDTIATATARIEGKLAVNEGRW